MSWETIDEGTLDRTERLAIGGGYLVRSVWRHARGLGVDPMDGSAMAFVPADEAAAEAPAPLMIADEAAEAVPAAEPAADDPAMEVHHEEAA